MRLIARMKLRRTVFIVFCLFWPIISLNLRNHNTWSLLMKRKKDNLFPDHLFGKKQKRMFALFTENLYCNDAEKSECSKENIAIPSVFDCAAIIAGTTIGGGFLALPSATAPAGMLPSAFALGLSWLYLLLTSFSMIRSIFQIRRLNAHHSSQYKPVSLFRISKEAFGSFPTIIVGVFFLSLMTSTLVAQLCKFGSLFAIANINRSGTIFIFTSFVSIFCGYMGPHIVEKVNSFLTAIMLAAFSVIIFAAGGAGWNIQGLLRADFGKLMPSLSTRSWVVPTLLQLLVYSETVPLICHRLRDEKKACLAVAFGSSVPLLMCVLWSAVALGIVPFESAADPLDKLLRSSSPGLITAVQVMAASAITTTVIGSCLALNQFFDDIFCPREVDSSVVRTSTGLEASTALVLPQRLEINKSRLSVNLWNQFDLIATFRNFSKIACIIVPLFIAAFGSQSLYYSATHFAGAFPVTFLWGLVPPLAGTACVTCFRAQRVIRGVESL